MEKVVLYGAGIQGEKWYTKWHNEYEIVYVIDRRCDKLFHGIPVYSLEQKKSELGEYKIIVAASMKVYHEIALSLIDLGLKENEDFLFSDLLNHELMILYGNCHMSVIEDYLMNNPEIVYDYTIMRFYVDYEDKRLRFPREALLAKCAIFITQDIRDNNKIDIPGYLELQKYTTDNCITVICPNVYGYNFFYPQMMEEDESINEIHIGEIYGARYINEMNAVQHMIIHYMQSYRDVNIDKLYGEGKKLQDILAYIEQDSLYDETEIMEKFRCSLDRLKEREKKCTIKISDYIENKYKDVQLFYEPYHPTNVLLCEMGKRIVEYLNKTVYETNRIVACLDYGELFIYKSVRKALGITFTQKYIKRVAINATLENKPMTLRDYVVNYIAWNYGEILD